MEPPARGSRWQLDRRNLLGSSVAVAASALILSTQFARAATTVSVTDPPFNASPNTSQDSSPAFQAALNYISNAGTGTLKIPPGIYCLSSPLTYSGGSLTIEGCGQGVTVIVMQHQGTGLTVNLNYSGCNLTARDFTIAPMPGQAVLAAAAIACLLPQQPAGWQNCTIEGIDFGGSLSLSGQQSTGFSNAIILQNTWRAHIANCTGYGNLLTGGVFISMQGECIDTRIIDCSVNSYAYFTTVSSYSEGLHIIDTSFTGGTALHTGSTSYNDNTNVNLLGLYISGCKFDCSNRVLSLYQVNSGWIYDSYLIGPQPGGGNIATELSGCVRLQMHNLLFNGQFPGTSDQIAIFATSSTQNATASCLSADCQFENTGTAIVLDLNTDAFIATGVAMYQYGASALVDGSVTLNNVTQTVQVDNSGNTTNNVSWLKSIGNLPKASTTRMGYER